MALPKPPKFGIWIGLAVAVALVFIFRPTKPPDELVRQAMEMKAQMWVEGQTAFFGGRDGTEEHASSADGDPHPNVLSGQFSLIDHTGQAVTDRDFLGGYTLVYFASTRCAGECEQGLNTIATAVNRIGQDATAITPIVITTDPEHDSIATLARFAATIHPRLSALTGSPTQVVQAAQAYGIDLENGAESSPIFLIDPEGRYLTHFDRTIAPDDLLANIQSYF